MGHRSMPISLSIFAIDHPESNGLAELKVQTVKNLLNKFLLDLKYNTLTINEKIENFLFKYRNTPNGVSGFSPSEVMFMFQHKTLMNK